MTPQEKWDALSSGARERLIAKRREYDVQDDWWSEHVVETFKEQMIAAGVCVDAVYWSGFSSQGDGACFTGYVSDPELFFIASGHGNLLSTLQHQAEGFALSWTSHGRYCHENTLLFEHNDPLVENPYDEENDTLRHAAFEILIGPPDVLCSCQADMAEWVKEACRSLYRSLNEEYDFLTSNEHVTEILIDLCPEEIDEAYDEEQELEGLPG